MLHAGTGIGSGSPYLIKNLEQVYILRYSKKTKSPMWSKFLIWKTPAKKNFFDQNENLCETSRKSLRTNFWCLINNKQNQRIQKRFQKIKTTNNNTFNIHITEYVSIYI